MAVGVAGVIYEADEVEVAEGAGTDVGVARMGLGFALGVGEVLTGFEILASVGKIIVAVGRGGTGVGTGTVETLDVAASGVGMGPRP